MAEHSTDRAIFRPTEAAVANSQLSDFMRFCEDHVEERFPGADAFYEWSAKSYRTFWSLFRDWANVTGRGDATVVCSGDLCETAQFFPNVRLSYVENVLMAEREGDDDRPALTACHAYGAPDRLSRRELRARVRSFAAALQRLGVGTGNRVVAVVHNNADAVIGALATAAVGATFSSAAPDMGAEAILSRFSQLDPKVMLANLHDAGNPACVGLAERISAISQSLPSLECLVVMDDQLLPPDLALPVYRLTQLCQPADSGDTAWEQFAFNHPLFALFSSGTTGAPKAIMHGAGGTLLEHIKEHRLHGDLRSSDKMFFHTSAAWMMWNWQLSALACQAEIVLYDGPVAGPHTLWQIASSEAVTVFGTSPAYLQMCQDSGYSPRLELDLGSLRSVLSTGSILYDSQFHWLSEHVGQLPIQSISGGTDILGCFVLGHPHLPVYPGECQSRSLGLEVVALALPDDAPGGPVGELGCRNPFPSRPLYFVGDPGGTRFHEAYFQKNPGVWSHGDLVEVTATKSVRMLGRSDGVLNVGGIRIGPAEIDAVVRSLPYVRQSMVVEQRHESSQEQSRLVLLVVMRNAGGLDEGRRREIRRELARRASSAHVPRLILEVSELPHTHSGKASERAARETLNGAVEVDVAGLRNPQSLAEIRARMAVESAAGESAIGRDLPRSSLTDLPSVMRGLWEELLSLAQVRDDDNFFDLGGTSLLAARLFVELHARCGIDLPPAALLSAPTLSALVHAAEHSETPSNSRLVLLKPGGERPVFLIPGLGGDVLTLRTLALALPLERAVYAVTSRPLVPGAPGHDRVEDLAADYLRHIRSLQPAGPYAFAGYSFGGLIAYEMARLLVGASEQVEFVGLLDSDLHHDCLPPIDRRRFLLRRRLSLRGRGLRPRLEQYLHPGTQTALRRQADLHWEAFTDYRPRKYPGTVTYFRCRRRRPGYCDPAPLWATAASGGIVTHTIASGHHDLLRPPGVDEVATRLAGLLARSQPRRGGEPSTMRWSTDGDSGGVHLPERQ